MPGISQKSESAMNKSKVNWRVAFAVSVACYLPAFLLVLTSGLVSYFLFQNSRTFPQDTSNLSSTNPPLTEQQVEEKIKKVLAQQAAIRTLKESSPLAEKYIDGQIRQEAQDQAEKAVKDEIDKLKADWKGDLFGQISFPVIFAIASIFAAFAVKDILTEILKDQEKEKIQQELEVKIRNDIVPKAISTERKETTDSIREIQVYLSWLEHELLKITMTQVIDELKLSSNYGSQKIEKSSLSAIEKLYDRSNLTLNTTFTAFEPDQFKILKQIECDFFKAKIKSIKLSKVVEDNLLSKIAEKFEPLKEDEEDKIWAEGEYTRMEDIFQLQKSLFIAKLHKLYYEESNDSQKSDLAYLIKYVSLAPKNALLEAEKKRIKIEKSNDESTDEINF